MNTDGDLFPCPPSNVSAHQDLTVSAVLHLVNTSDNLHADLGEVGDPLIDIIVNLCKPVELMRILCRLRSV